MSTVLGDYNEVGCLGCNLLIINLLVIVVVRVKAEWVRI